MDCTIKEDNKVLITSELGLTYMIYSFSGSENTWRNSSPRAFLNDRFYRDSFTSEEKKYIIQTNTTIDVNQENKNVSNTWNRVFLLSVEETNKYLIANSINISPQ